MITINENLQAKLTGSLPLVLCLMFALTFFYTIWQWNNDYKLAYKSGPVQTPMMNTDTTRDLIRTIPDAHLFGEAAEINKLGKIPITSLKLRVTGIVLSEEQKEPNHTTSSKAMISMAGHPSKIYKTGDMLPLGVKVYAITASSVILENDGRLEKLPLPRQTLQFKHQKLKELY